MQTLQPSLIKTTTLAKNEFTWNLFSCTFSCVCVCICVCVACGILVPQPEIEPQASAVKVQSPHHWATREISSGTSY